MPGQVSILFIHGEQILKFTNIELSEGNILILEIKTSNRKANCL